MISSVGIANLALQMVGQKAITDFSDNSKSAVEISTCYDMLRLAELRRNCWLFSVRRTPLRAIDTSTMFPVFAAWNNSPSPAYTPYDIVTSNGTLYQNLTGVNDTPGIDDDDANWQPYFGPMTIAAYDTTGSTAYRSTEFVYGLNGSNQTVVFMSLQDNNSEVPLFAQTVWSGANTYNQGDMVTGSDSNTYQSLLNDNLNNNPTTDSVYAFWVPVNSSWKIMSTITVRSNNIIYPIGAGPSSFSGSRNVYVLPANYLRHAPQNPKASVYAPLGGPTGNLYTDWVLENGYLTSDFPGPILLRFGANIENAVQFDPMFSLGLASRIALQICEPLTQSEAKLQTISQEYKKFMEKRGCSMLLRPDLRTRVKTN